MTGSNPDSRHWAGKVSTVSTPPNAVVVTQDEARALVNWLLVLVPWQTGSFAAQIVATVRSR